MKYLATIGLVSVALTFAMAQDVQHPIAVELVGKWCFLNLANGGNGMQSETCITLNDDGTYEFNVDGATMMKANSFFPGTKLQERDAGTWWTRGNTLFYNSSSHGEGSLEYQKVNQPHNESVPTIVVGGQYFVCVTTHDPW